MILELGQIKLLEYCYLHRCYPKDISKSSNENSWLDLGKRIVLVALPFVSLYKPLGSNLTLVLGGFRAGNSGVLLCTSLQKGSLKDTSYQIFQTSIAVASFVATVFAHPMGVAITTTHDSITEIENLRQYLNAKDSEKAIKSCLNIINNSLSLALLIRGGLELTVASLAMQVLTSLCHFQSEFKKGNHLECAGHFLMGMVRCNQLYGQVNLLKMRWEINALVKQGNLSKSNTKEKRVQELIAVIDKYQNYSFPNGYNNNNFSPSVKACITGDKNAVSILLQHGFDLNSVIDPMTPKQTILFYGLQYWGGNGAGLGHVDKAEMFSFLVANGADVNKCHEGLSFAIHQLLPTGQAGVNAIKLAIQRGASLTGVLNRVLSWHPPQGSESEYKNRIVELLIASGAKLG